MIEFQPWVSRVVIDKTTEEIILMTSEGENEFFEHVF